MGVPHGGQDPGSKCRVDVQCFAGTVDHHRHSGIESQALEQVAVPRRIEQLHWHAALAGP